MQILILYTAINIYLVIRILNVYTRTFQKPEISIMYMIIYTLLNYSKTLSQKKIICHTYFIEISIT